MKIIDRENESLLVAHCSTTESDNGNKKEQKKVILTNTDSGLQFETIKQAQNMLKKVGWGFRIVNS